MLTDIEIAQQAKLRPIGQVAASLNIPEEDLEYYGKYKAKISDELFRSVQDRSDGKLILLTAINPTPAGEGKTTTSIGLGEAMTQLGKKTVIALREPSLGPVFGIKGGAAGGGYSQVVPMRTSISTSPGICMPLRLPTTCSAPCWTTICSRGTLWGLTPDGSSLSAVLT